MTDTSRVFLGRFQKPLGLTGRLVLRVFVVGHARPLPPGTPLYCGDRTLRLVSSSERDATSVTVMLEGVSHREAAEILKGEEVFVTPEWVLASGLPLPVHFFPGFTVVSRGLDIPVRDVEWNPVNPLLLLEGPRGTFPAPLNLLLQGKVDLEGRRIVTDLPEGLEEL